MISGGAGEDIFNLKRALGKTEIADDGSTLYIRKGARDMTIARDVESIRSKEPRFLFSKEVDFAVMDPRAAIAP